MVVRISKLIARKVKVKEKAKMDIKEVSHPGKVDGVEASPRAKVKETSFKDIAKVVVNGATDGQTAPRVKEEEE